MLTEICDYLNNWFDIDEYHAKLPRLEGKFRIVDGVLPDLENLLIKGQCFYIYGSYLNDGVYVYDEVLRLLDETFTGIIQSMRVEPGFLKLAEEMQEWQEKYGAVSSEAMSPFQSESFAGYSYSKGSGGGNGSGQTGADPFSVFAPRLRRWKKL